MTHTTRNIALLTASWVMFVAVILYPQLFLVALAIGSIYVWTAREETA